MAGIKSMVAAGVAVGMGMVLFMLSLAAVAGAGGPSCDQIISSFDNCAPFLTISSVLTPSQNCCAATKAMDTEIAAGGTAMVLQACKCLGAAARTIGPKLVLSHAKSLPGMCALRVLQFDPASQC